MSTNRDADRESLTKLLAEHGLEGNYEMHSWRCQHPDRYGACECVSELIDDLAGLMLSIRAAAWDELVAELPRGMTIPANPYREVTE